MTTSSARSHEEGKDEMDEQYEPDDAAVDEETLKDLDVDQDDADKVLGGTRRKGDPCEGGE
jgi:hypothetical protein